MKANLWTNLAHKLRLEVAYCEPLSPLYTRLFGTFHGWSRTIRDGVAPEPHVARFRDVVESCWRERTFHYDFEPVLLLSATIHRLVLNEGAPELSPFFATVGGAFEEARDGAAFADALAALFRRAPERIQGTLADQRLGVAEVG